MLSFRQKIFVSYLFVFLIFILLMLPFVSHWVQKIVLHSIESSSVQIIAYIKNAPNNDALVRRLKDQKSMMFFRTSIITNEHKVLYDSHTKRVLGAKFNQNFVVDHPEVLQAFKEGTGYHEDYSQILHQQFAYFAKAFDFHGKTYVLRTAFPYEFVQRLKYDFEIGFLVLAILILLLFSCMTWIVVHYLTQPIQNIINAVKPYQEGTVKTLPAIHLSNVNPNDDFNKLASTLNSLSKKIQSHIDILTKERNEKETILESLVEGVIAVNNDMEATYTNAMSLKLMQRVEALTGKKFSIPEQELASALLRQCRKEKKPLTDTLEFIKEGKKIYLDITAAPKKNDEGAVLVLEDKTAHHKIFEMRRDFIANASHELKTPITIIKGFAEALHDNPELSLETRSEVTGKIVRNCNRMTALIKDLLTLADIENIPSSRLCLFDLYELIKHCSSMLVEIFPDANVVIDKAAFIISSQDSAGRGKTRSKQSGLKEEGMAKAMSDEEDRSGEAAAGRIPDEMMKVADKNKDEMLLYADKELMEMAFLNLIENAAKYSNRPAQIHISLEEAGDDVIIRVADQGIGIPLADQEHIFDRFYTVDKAHSQKMGGSGLGLAIVKTIVEKHFGTISLQSEKGKGSTFIIRLPKYYEIIPD